MKIGNAEILTKSQTEEMIKYYKEYKVEAIWQDVRLLRDELNILRRQIETLKETINDN